LIYFLAYFFHPVTLSLISVHIGRTQRRWAFSLVYGTRRLFVVNDTMHAQLQRCGADASLRGYL